MEPDAVAGARDESELAVEGRDLDVDVLRHGILLNCAGAKLASGGEVNLQCSLAAGTSVMLRSSSIQDSLIQGFPIPG
ncbi:hypothetical protein ACFPRL_18015 [Pseudoclavibacter helvolus]